MKKKRDRTANNSSSDATKKKKEGNNGLEFPQPKPVGCISSIGAKCSQFFGSFVPSKHQIRDKQLQNRMKICILAVCLMWATSLRVAVYISKHAINVPSIQLLYESSKSAFKIALEEKEKYAECIRVQLDQCTDDLDQSTITEVRRVNASSTKNTDILNSISGSYETCASDYTSLRYSLEGWVNTGQSLPLDSSTCSALEQQQIMASIGDINLIRSEAKALSREYGLNSQNTVQSIASFAKARSEYDLQYLDNHTQAMRGVVQDYMNEISQNIPDLDVDNIFQELYDNLDSAVSCITPRNPNKGQCANITGVYDLIDDAYANWVDMTTVYINHAQEMGKRFQQYKDNVNSAYQVSSSFYYSVKDAILDDWAISWMWGDWVNVDVTSFLPADINMPAFPNTDDIIKKIPSLDKFFFDVRPSYDELLLKVEDARDGIYQAVSQFQMGVELELLDVNKIPGMLPEDYNPPTYIGVQTNISDLESEEELHKNMTKNFVSRSSSALDAFSKFTANFTPEEGEIEMPSVNISNIQNRITNVDLSFERLMKPNLEFDLWFIKFASVSELLFMLDFVFRIYFTIRMFFKYWDAGSIKLPEIDVRKYREVKNPLLMSNGRFVILLFTNPLIGALLMMLVGTWVLTFASSVYTPLYLEYTNGCVPQDGNGTFTTSNLYSMTYNFAYQDGSTSLVSGMELFDKERSSRCSSIYAKTASKQNDDMLQISSFSQSLEATSEKMELLEKCIDIDLANVQFLSACCGKNGYPECSTNNTLTNETSHICPMDDRYGHSSPFQTPEHYLAKKSCSSQTDKNESNLFDATFDCEVLPSCLVTCTGPHKEKLRKISKECGCLAEWFLHSVWLQGIISLMVFALLNASRISFVDGLTRVLWKSLHPGTFTVWATCNEKGKFLAQSFNAASLSFKSDGEIPSQSIRLNGQIRKQVEWNSFVFRVGGAVLMMVALSLNVPWILVIVRSSDATSPKWLL